MGSESMPAGILLRVVKSCSNWVYCRENDVSTRAPSGPSHQKGARAFIRPLGMIAPRNGLLEIARWEMPIAFR